MNKDNFFDRERPSEGTSEKRSSFTGDRSFSNREYSTRTRHDSSSQDQMPRRRRRIGEMGYSSDNQSSRPYERNKQDFAGHPRRYEDGDRPRRREEYQSTPSTDYKERYNEVREHNRQRYGDEAFQQDRPQQRRPYQRNNYYNNGTDEGRTGNSGSPRKPYNNNNRSTESSDERRPYGKNRLQNSTNGRRPMKKGPAPKRKERQIPVYEQNELDPNEPIRLNKFLANSGVSSRREADELIEAGGVLVNGIPVTELGTKITLNDRVEVNGKEVKPENKVYVLLNKPRNCVTTSEDPQERLTVMHLVRSAAKERIYPVGRLDRNTTGVLLLTNDGELASKLVHPSFKKKKIYHVWLDKEVSVDDMQKITDGIELEDGEMHADAISYVSDDDLSQVGIEIHSGRNRIVRRIFEHLGYRVIKLDRVYFAGLTKKNLGRGKWRYLTQQEVNNLKMGAFD